MAQPEYKIDTVRVATTENVSLGEAPSVIDGVNMVHGNKMLLKDQTTASENGIYQWRNEGRLSRVIGKKVASGLLIQVEEGTVNGDVLFSLVTNNPITVGETDLAFAPVSPEDDDSVYATITYVDDSIAAIPSGGVELGDNNVWTGTNTFNQDVTFGTIPFGESVDFYSNTVIGPTTAAIFKANNIETQNNAGLGVLLQGDGAIFQLTGAASDYYQNVQVDGEAGYRARFRSNGKIEFGDGTNPTDVFITRESGGGLHMNAFAAGGYMQFDADSAFYFNAPAFNFPNPCVIDVMNNRLRNLADPAAPQDAVTLQYFNDNAGGVTLNTDETITGKKTFEGTSSGEVNFASKRDVDSFDRLQIRSDGSLMIGDGTSSPTTALRFNTEVSTWGVVNGFAIEGGVVAKESSMGTKFLYATTDLSNLSIAPFTATIGGRLEWGDGTAVADTNLYRDTAGVLKTDTALQVGTFLNVLADFTAGSSPSDVLSFHGAPAVSQQATPVTLGDVITVLQNLGLVA
jgi:hypothetical protein